jgi:hypothetical protein
LLISGKYANISELKLKSSLDTIDDSRTYFSSIYPDGSLSWSVNNSGPSFPKGTSLVESVDGHYLSSDIYLTEVNIDGRILTPTDNWFNSYLASHNSEGSISNILLQLPGIITSVITDSHESIIVTGTSSNSIGISGAYNSTGGFIDFFIGKLSCPLADELSVKDGGSAEIMEYNIFPNPTSNKYCTIESRTVTIVDGINITNQDGKLLQYDTDCSLPYKLDLFYLSKGTYFVSIIKGSITVTRQVVIN